MANQTHGCGLLGSKTASVAVTVSAYPTPTISPRTIPEPTSAVPVARASIAVAMAARRYSSAGTAYETGFACGGCRDSSHPIERIHGRPRNAGVNHTAPRAKYTTAATMTASQFSWPRVSRIMRQLSSQDPELVDALQIDDNRFVRLGRLVADRDRGLAERQELTSRAQVGVVLLTRHQVRRAGDDIASQPHEDVVLLPPHAQVERADVRWRHDDEQVGRLDRQPLVRGGGQEAERRAGVQAVAEALVGGLHPAGQVRIGQEEADLREGGGRRLPPAGGA